MSSEDEFTPHIPGQVAQAGAPDSGGDDVQDALESDTPLVNIGGSGRGSVRDRLKDRHAGLADEREPLDLDIPGENGELFVRFKYVPAGVLGKNAEKLNKIKNPAERTLIASIDTLVGCCAGFFIREDPSKPDDYEPLAEDGTTILFDASLVEALGGDASKVNSARKACMFVYGSNDYVVLAEAEKVSEWLRESDDNDESFYEALTGNSKGPTR